MWWDVGTLGHVTQVTEVALVYHFVVIGLVDAIDLQGRGLVHQVE
jgi:hypothetical protein